MLADTLLPVVCPALPGWESWPPVVHSTHLPLQAVSVLHCEPGAGARACLSSPFLQPSVAECSQHPSVT